MKFSILIVTTLFSCHFGISQPQKETNVKQSKILVETTGEGLFKLGEFSQEFDIPQEVEIQMSEFYINGTEITNSEYQAFLEDINISKEGKVNREIYINLKSTYNIYWSKNKILIKEGKENFPVVNVTWYGAQEYCKWKGGSLPSEAQWEYAANSGHKYSGSNDPLDVAWYLENSQGKSHEVATKKPNVLGIYDMSGNVMEWVNDWYRKNYSADAFFNPSGPNRGKYKIARGGAWNRNEKLLNISNRYPLLPSYLNNNLGFRCAFNQ